VSQNACHALHCTVLQEWFAHVKKNRKEKRKEGGSRRTRERREGELLDLGVFNGPQIRQIVANENFVSNLSRLEAEA